MKRPTRKVVGQEETKKMANQRAEAQEKIATSNAQGIGYPKKAVPTVAKSKPKPGPLSCVRCGSQSKIATGDRYCTECAFDNEFGTIRTGFMIESLALYAERLPVIVEHNGKKLNIGNVFLDVRLGKIVITTK